MDAFAALVRRLTSGLNCELLFEPGRALVAEAAMRALQVDTLEICPWALREGVILRRLDAEQADALEPTPVQGVREGVG